MTPDVVVDVGNSFTKFGVVFGDKIALNSSAADLDDESGFFDSVAPNSRPTYWLVAGVNPERQAGFVAWARGRGDSVTEVTSHDQLPVRVDVEHPARVGLDRLLGAVAANRLRAPGRAALTVDVGTAVTINQLNTTGVFTGGLILPGPWLMAESLYGHTAKLPRVAFAGQLAPSFPGRSTDAAIRSGVAFAIAGAVRLAVDHARAAGDDDPEIFLTGGGMSALGDLLGDFNPRREPTLNLDGLLITAETLP